MNQYGPPLPTNTDGSNRLKIYRNIQANETVTGPGSAVSRGPAGSVIEHLPSYQGAGLKYGTPYNTSSEWHMGEITRVSEDRDYFGDGHTSTAGPWICVSPIPRQLSTADSTACPEMARLAGINYAPLDPEPATLAHEVTNVATQGRYWEKLGGSGGSVSYNIYDYSSSYSQNTFVRTNTTVEYSNGTSSKWQYPGVWIVRSAVSALSGSYPSGSRGTNFQVPVYPTGSYYDLIAMSPTTMSLCIGGVDTQFWIHGKQIEPSGSTLIRI